MPSTPDKRLTRSEGANPTSSKVSVVDEQAIHSQFVKIALSLTPPLLRNKNVQSAQEAVALYMEVYDSVIQAAVANQEQPSET